MDDIWVVYNHVSRKYTHLFMKRDYEVLILETILIYELQNSEVMVPKQ